MDGLLYLLRNFQKIHQSGEYQFKDYNSDNLSIIDFSQNELQTNNSAKVFKPGESMRRLDTLEANN